MIFDLIYGRLDFTSALVGILACLLIIFFVLPFHEWAHGFVAYKLGDKTAKYSGRLSLNPLTHIDPMGAVCLLLFNFGWAKPVPVDPGILKIQRPVWHLWRLQGRWQTFWPPLWGACF